MSVFSEKDTNAIKKFLYTDFFVICQLYEFSLKPRMQLMLKNEPYVPDLPELENLDAMERVDDPEQIQDLHPYFDYVPPIEDFDDEYEDVQEGMANE
jgi:hypothetical protein